MGFKAFAQILQCFVVDLFTPEKLVNLHVNFSRSRILWDQIGKFSWTEKRKHGRKEWIRKPFAEQTADNSSFSHLGKIFFKGKSSKIFAWEKNLLLLEKKGKGKNDKAVYCKNFRVIFSREVRFFKVWPRRLTPTSLISAHLSRD